MKGQTESPLSYSSNITMRNINLKCHNFLNVSDSKQYNLSKFTFENINVETTKKASIELDYIKDLKLKNISIKTP